MDDLQNGLVKTQQDSPQWIPVNVQCSTEGNACQKAMMHA